MVAIEKNRDGSGGMFWGGMSVPDYHEGDQAFAGRTIAQVIDPNESDLLRDQLKGETTEHADPPRLEDEGQSGG